MLLKLLLKLEIYLFSSIINKKNMSRKIKLLWDFRGPDAKETAKHHTIHLKEFATLENLNFYEIDILEKNEMLVSAFITVDEKDMKIYRDALKPQRGEVA